jgi:hypothetical protein
LIEYTLIGLFILRCAYSLNPCSKRSIRSIRCTIVHWLNYSISLVSSLNPSTIYHLIRLSMLSDFASLDNLKGNYKASLKNLLICVLIFIWNQFNSWSCSTSNIISHFIRLVKSDACRSILNLTKTMILSLLILLLISYSISIVWWWFNSKTLINTSTSSVLSIIVCKIIFIHCVNIAINLLWDTGILLNLLV